MEVCGGMEHFLSYDDVGIDALIGFLRLRFPGKPHRPELDGAAVIRELHVYGKMVPIGCRDDNGQPMVPIGGHDEAWQHRGYGKELLKRAEAITADAGYGKIAVISGIGAREYYRKLGYARDGPYMSKRLG
jgi:elongator complex protein 3